MLGPPSATPALSGDVLERVRRILEHALSLQVCEPEVRSDIEHALDLLGSAAIAAIRELEARCERARADAIEDAAGVCEEEADRVRAHMRAFERMGNDDAVRDLQSRLDKCIALATHHIRALAPAPAAEG